MSFASEEPIPYSPLRLAVLLSGSGRTLQNMADAITQGHLDAEIRLVVSSQADAYGLTRAEKLGIPAVAVPRRDYADVDAFSQAIWQQVRDTDVDVVCLAGFLSLLRIPDDFVGRVVNIHPSLLPCFGGKGMYGRKVHEAVLEAGCKVSGCTVHYCDQHYDTGPIIAQRACQVLPSDTPDTLASRVFEQECIAYIEALRLIAAGRVQIDGRLTRILPPRQDA